MNGDLMLLNQLKLEIVVLQCSHIRQKSVAVVVVVVIVIVYFLLFVLSCQYQYK